VIGVVPVWGVSQECCLTSLANSAYKKEACIQCDRTPWLLSVLGQGVFVGTAGYKLTPISSINKH